VISRRKHWASFAPKPWKKGDPEPEKMGHRSPAQTDHHIGSPVLFAFRRQDMKVIFMINYSNAELNRACRTNSIYNQRLAIFIIFSSNEGNEPMHYSCRKSEKYAISGLKRTLLIFGSVLNII